MGLKDTMRNAATSAIAAIGDMSTPIEYHSLVVGNYDVALDARAVTDTVLNIKGLYYKGKEDEQDYKKSVLNEFKVLIAGEAFGAVEPGANDFMVIKGRKHEIKGIKLIPGDAAFIFIVRIV